MNTKSQTHDERKSVVSALVLFCALVIVAALGTFSSYQASASVGDEQASSSTTAPAKKQSYKVNKSDSTKSLTSDNKKAAASTKDGTASNDSQIEKNDETSSGGASSDTKTVSDGSTSNPTNESNTSGSVASSSSTSSNSTSGSSSSAAVSSDSSSNTSSSSASSEPNRRWVVDYKTIEHPEVSHMETVTISEGYWDKQYVGKKWVCSDGFESTSLNEIDAHIKAAGRGANISYGSVPVYEDVWVEPVTEQRKVVDQAAWTETVEDGGHWEYY